MVWHSSAQVWAEIHERAFRRLGGTVRVIVLDNLKEGVLTLDIYDPALNPLYRDVLTHYGAVALPYRIGDPDRTRSTHARLTAYLAATSFDGRPASESRNTRVRKSIEYGAMAPPAREVP